MKKMRNKCIVFLLLFALTVSMMAACGNVQQTPSTDQTQPSEETKGDDGYRVGSVVSDAYVDPDKYKVDASKLKAQGYEYDLESLTYTLVWSDEFDYEGAPDPTKWGYDVGGSGWGNNELQYYTAGDNVTVKDGMCIITLCAEDLGGRNYTSTRMVTRGKGDWLYGKIEVCAKLPAGKGTWPAIWMLPTDYRYGDWPASGEIDIMEHVGYNPDWIVQSVHCNKYYAGASKSSSNYYEGVTEEFHIYGVEWLPDKIIFTVDGEVTGTYDPNKLSSQPTYEHWPFDKRMHLLINLAFGGDWGGAMGVEDDYLPVEYYIDYVRVYQSPEILELTDQS